MEKNMNLMLDSFALIEFFQGTKKGEKVKEYIEKAKKIYVSTLSLFEIGTALEKQIGRKKAEDYLRSIKSFYKITDVTKEVATVAINLKRKFKMPAIDCLIYASAKTNNTNIISGCKHFKSISDEKDVIIV